MRMISDAICIAIVHEQYRGRNEELQILVHTSPAYYVYTTSPTTAYKSFCLQTTQLLHLIGTLHSGPIHAWKEG